MLGTVNALKPWGVSSLTLPFVLTTWLLLLATYGFSGLIGPALPAGDVVVAFQPYEASPLKLIDLLQGVLQSISQVFLKANGVAGLLLLAGLAVNSWAAAAFALAGAILAVLTAHLFGAESELITGGLLGFSPVLTAIALGACLPTELAGRDLRHAGHAVYGHRTSGAERRLDAPRHPCAYRAFCARHMDIPSSTPVFRASRPQRTMPRQRAQARSCFFGGPHV